MDSSQQDEQLLEDGEQKPIQATSGVRVVAIGASAGGMDALVRFLEHTPSEAGLAYALIQHQSPSHPGLLAEVLQRATRLQVLQIQDRLVAEANTIYVNPADFDIAFIQGRFHLLEPSNPHGYWRPIDFFFRSYAEDQGEQAICMVLSGAGTDGSLGVRAVKGEGGIVMAQLPETAQFASMPQSAIATGLVDFVLAPEEMFEQIVRCIEKTGKLVRQDERSDKTLNDGRTMDKVFLLLRSHTGHDFSLYKRTTLRRRIERRILVNRLNNLNDYVQLIQHQPRELDALFHEILIGVTEFFRDPHSFATLEEKVLQPMLVNRASDDPLRVWSAGCSTGEEAYSIAMLLHEQMLASGRSIAAQIFATDIDSHSIEHARRGLYSDGIAIHLTPERLSRFFMHEGSSYRVKREVREMIVFAVQNAIQDPPFSNLDLLTCRNLLIYLEPELQEKLIVLIHYALKPGGYLFLGNSETLGKYGYLFRPIDAQSRLYQRRDGLTPEAVPHFNVSLHHPHTLQPINTRQVITVERPARLRQQAESVLLEQYTPPAVVVSAQGDILYFHERTGRYLEPAPGEASLNIFRMAREGLRLPLSNAIRKVVTQRLEVIEEQVQVKIDGETQLIDLIVRPFQTADVSQDLLLVVFQEVKPTPAVPALESSAPVQHHERTVELERELQIAREYLQTVIEELEASNEELKSTNEELQSSNEELQSANEELTSAKEELQSVNEELVTMNSELESKIDELTHANDDLRNLLTSVDIGIIFLDRHLRVARFNPAATRLINLIEADIGRPFAHIASNLDYGHLIEDIRETLAALHPKEMEVRAGKQWYSMRIRPYRTIQDMIDGVIITFTEITDQKVDQYALRKLSRAVDQSLSMILITDNEGQIEYANQRFYDMTDFETDDVIGQPYYKLTADDYMDGRVYENVVRGEEWQGELLKRRKNGEPFWVQASLSPIRDEQNRVINIVAVEENINARKLFEEELQRRHGHKSEDMPPIAILVFDHDLRPLMSKGDGLAKELETDSFMHLFSNNNDLERYYRAALRGDNVYFESEAGELRVGIQVMPVRNAQGKIIAGTAIAWNITSPPNK